MRERLVPGRSQRAWAVCGEMKKVKIDRKLFMVRRSWDGRKISWKSEEEGPRGGRLALDWGTVVWLRDCLLTATRLVSRQGFWKRRLESAIVFFLVLSNAKGWFGLVFVELFRGRRASVYISVGRKD